jgi:hypothetical protein
MNAFIVEIMNKPGELARAAEALATRGVNITGFTGATCGDSGSACFVTNDEMGTRRALQEAKYTFHERELVVASLADRPGSLGEAARKLASAGVNIEAALPTGMSGGSIHVAFATDDATKARSALADSILSGSATR